MVLEVMKKCILSVPYSRKLGEVVRNVLLSDSSIHNTLFHIVCTTPQDLEKIYVSRLYDLMEIEGLQLAISSALDILFSMLSDLSKDSLPSLSAFHQVMLSSTTKPIPVVTAVISLISCFRNPRIQMGAVRVLSMLLVVAEYSQLYVFRNACFGLDDKQIADFRNSVNSILCEQSLWNEDLIVATLKLLTYAARCQPAFLAAVTGFKENVNVQLSGDDGAKRPDGGAIGSLVSKEANLLDTILQYVGRSEHLIKRVTHFDLMSFIFSKPYLLLNLLNFLKALWQEAVQFTTMLELLKKSEKFWSQLTSSILLTTSIHDDPSENLTETEALSSAYRYQCQGDILQIMAYEIFLQKKLLQSESSKNGIENKVHSEKPKDASLCGLNNILSTWQESSAFGNLIKSYASCKYDNDVYLRAKIFLQKKLLQSESSKNGIENKVHSEKPKDASLCGLNNILSTWQESSAFGNLIKSYASCKYDNDVYLRAKIFLQKKLLQSESSKNGIENKVHSEKPKDASLCGLNNILSTWQESSAFGNLIKSYASCKYDNDVYLRAKIAGALVSVHLMAKLKCGDTGSLSVALIDKIHILSQKLCSLPAFNELSSQYTERGYSEGKELHSLILSDLYYHLQGELEGRKIDHRPFKELSQYLLESNLLHTYSRQYDGDVVAHAKDVHLFDSIRLRADLGLDIWDLSEWKTSKAVAETMLLRLQDVNSMVLLASSKLSALKALIAILSVHGKDSIEKNSTVDGKIPEQLILSSIDHTCQCLHATIELLAPVPHASEDILDFLAAQAELLLHLIVSLYKRLSLPASVHILKTSGYGLKVLSGSRPGVAGGRTTIRVLLVLLLLSVDLIRLNSGSDEGTRMESVEVVAEASIASLGLLPILCNCIEPADNFAAFCSELQDPNSYASVPVILKFLLTLAQSREGAEMLLNAGFFASLRVLFDGVRDDIPLSVIQRERSLSNSSEKSEKPQCIWGLGLAVVTAMIHSLRGSFFWYRCRGSCDGLLLLEKSDVIYYYLNAPDFPSDDHDKKRAPAPKTPTSLNALKETEHTLFLICVLAKQ
ncbi:unnamed protein product, partial [Ilex paraguariensis]